MLMSSTISIHTTICSLTAASGLFNGLYSMDSIVMEDLNHLLDMSLHRGSLDCSIYRIPFCI